VLLAQGEAEQASLDYLKRTCTSGEATSCTELAEVYAKGKYKGVAKDPAKAAELYARAAKLNQAECDKEGGDACFELARAYEAGLGVPQDASRAAALNKKTITQYQQACDRGQMNECEALGLSYEKGRGIAMNLARAAALYKKACDGGDKGACERVRALNAH
jgi:TPR repeat protein